MFQPSLDFVDLHSRANGAMRTMDSIPWWRTEIKQGSEVYLQLNDYMIAGEGEDPADNPIITKSVKAEARATCRVLHGKMNDIAGISFARSRNPSIASGSVNDILANYFFYSTIIMTWTVPEYSLMQCSVGGVQSPVLELFPVALSPSQTYQGCGSYPEAKVVSDGTCISRSKFDLNHKLSCFPIGVTLPSIVFSVLSFDGTMLPQAQQVNLDIIDIDVQNSVVAAPFSMLRLNANEIQVSGRA